MTKEKLIKENEILKKRLGEIYKLLQNKLDDEKINETIGRCQATIECIQDIDNISLGIKEYK